jgi:hypothetical protein
MNQKGATDFKGIEVTNTDFVASYYFYQLRTPCASECNRYGYPIRVCAIGFNFL